jgi:hypothetical protein
MWIDEMEDDEKMWWWRWLRMVSMSENHTQLCDQEMIE